MNRSVIPPRVVIVTRPTWYEALIARHGTAQQAAFFLKTRGESLEPIAEQHAQFSEALREVLNAIPVEWRRARVPRDDLDRFLFEPEDIVVALGQDGLVANTAKYLDGQPVVGVNPSPEYFPGVLVRLPPKAVPDLLRAVQAGRGRFEERTMVLATLDDGQRLLALNEVFAGHSSHQSARYLLHWQGGQELQSSSGVIVSTGTGATGWAASILRERRCDIRLPAPSETRLTFFVREAWPSATTGTQFTEGEVTPSQPLVITSRMNEDGVIFGDGIESDRLEFSWGRQLTVSIAPSRLRLVLEA